MQYISTRGAAPVLAFDDALLAGLARDGGLYVPQSWPRFAPGDWRAMRGLPYAELVARVIRPFVGGAIDEATLAQLAHAAYAGFDHRAVAPLKQLDANLWLMELFHGPTLAFKDFALQLLGRLFDHVLAARGTHATIVGATSGDTGSAAIEACRDRDCLDIFMLHPHGRVSEVQRRQMTTVVSANVHNIAIDGSFDDCQDLVKGLFNDHAFRDRVGLSAVNSINWARIVAQIAYYAHAALALGAPERPVGFAVPTGNFGNVYSAYAARAIGLPVDLLIVGSNSNDILTRFFQSGEMRIGTVTPTLSPSMDIQVSSNAERLLFDLYDRDGAALAAAMRGFRADGRLDVGEARLKRARTLFAAARLDDAETKAVIAEECRATGEIVDPHSAIGLAAARRVERPRDLPVVALATAHPAKFPDAVEAAIGRRPALPARLQDLMAREERCMHLPNDLAIVREFILARATARDGKRTAA
ncbi:MAG: threonine synthase [Alphaproteobacteria bacterium]|nr:threonine synthase [Alphaproteobacteria bacterium]